MNGTLNAMPDEFAIILRKVSDDSLGRDETSRHASQEFFTSKWFITLKCTIEKYPHNAQVRLSDMKRPMMKKQDLTAAAIGRWF